MENEIPTLNFKIKIHNLEKYEEKIDQIKKLVQEINETGLKVDVVQDEMNDLIDCVDQAKKELEN